jgi:hypothetical protein
MPGAVRTTTPYALLFSQDKMAEIVAASQVSGLAIAQSLQDLTRWPPGKRYCTATGPITLPSGLSAA